MTHQTIPLPVHYADKLNTNGHQPTLTTYLLQNDSVPARPLVIVCPGGGYDHHSTREAEAVCYARAHADEWHVDAQSIIACGFSAGGHLCATLGCYWNSGLFAPYLPHNAKDIKPDALILSYPVITADEPYCHPSSIRHVLGSAARFSRDDVSIERHVTGDFPPTFLWHTLADQSVPAENSLRLANALRRAGVPFAYHLFTHGKHGLALATPETATSDGSTVEPECAVWVDLFKTWWECRGHES